MRLRPPEGDIAILALGEDAGEMTGEATSRAHLDLPGRQQVLLEKVVATGTPVVFVLFSGRPLTLPWAFEHASAVLAAWFPGIRLAPRSIVFSMGSGSEREACGQLAEGCRKGAALLQRPQHRKAGREYGFKPAAEERR